MMITLHKLWHLWQFIYFQHPVSQCEVIQRSSTSAKHDYVTDAMTIFTIDSYKNKGNVTQMIIVQCKHISDTETPASIHQWPRNRLFCFKKRSWNSKRMKNFHPKISQLTMTVHRTNRLSYYFRMSLLNMSASYQSFSF